MNVTFHIDLVHKNLLYDCQEYAVTTAWCFRRELFLINCQSLGLKKKNHYYSLLPFSAVWGNVTKGPDLALEEGLLSSYIEKPNINMKHVQTLAC